MQTRFSVDQATGRRHSRRASTPGARRPLSWALVVAAVLLPLLALFGTVGPAAADTTYAPTTFVPGGECSKQYLVPAGIRYVQVVASGGAGQGGASYNSNNTGGAGGSGAKVTAIVPVFPLRPEKDDNGTAIRLHVHVGQNAVVGNGGGGLFAGSPTADGNGGGGGPSIVVASPDRACPATPGGTLTYPDGTNPYALLVAGGGGGGGAGNTFGSGGAGGSAGFSGDVTKLDGQAGSSAYALSTGCGNGGGGGGGAATAAGGGGAAGCVKGIPGRGGSAQYGGEAADNELGASGAGGGGWRGGGSGGSGYTLGGGGGGAGSSYLSAAVGFYYDNSTGAYTPPVRPVSIGQADKSQTPSVTITPLPTPTTTATLSGTTSGNNWFTAAPTVTLTASAAGGPGVKTTYYALDNPACSATNLAVCTEYKGPFTASSDGLHTLTYFSVDTQGLDEGVQTTRFVLTPTSVAVSGAIIVSGTNPAVATADGTISVRGTGEGTIGTAVYATNPAGPAVFSSSGGYIDVIAAGSGLTDVTFTDCALSGGTQISWWNGTAWALASNQSYDSTTKCVTVTVDATTSPSVSQLTGTVFGIGNPPTIAATATTADGKPYAAGTWTNQSVTVTFTCSAGATPSAPVTRTGDGQGQTADGTCTDGLGQARTTTFAGINVDKTPPSCAVRVSPTVIWSPDGKPVAITGTVTAGDNLSGLATVVGGAVTSNEKLGRNDVRGFIINTPYATPLKLGAVVNFTGTLVATRAGDGRGRTYAQLVTITDQAGNTATCTWTVTVPRDQR